jgi:dihydrofolate reductase
MAAPPNLQRLVAVRPASSLDWSVVERLGAHLDIVNDADSIAGILINLYEFQVPIFVVTHEPPSATPRQHEHLTFTFVTDGVKSAIAQASAAAGDKAVTVVGGPNVIQQLLRAGVVDELRLDVVPVMLGGGLRLFEQPDSGVIELEKISVQEIGPRTSLRFRIQR